ncbi:3-carboxy-cis,cis-muconate cycloisomerase [Loktanella atrilutea]|uniref:3-carboxy-cis,cis-muconate cycloisomerase n=1 Tax=Loktanella atrilutea TaxID=366533 RepID=A0A1M5B0G8_LOKAT|nr:3-carboxy-cis,cis-muconate cycloisomerase [Loktanella atrilutea]SHF35940.1 3-carboxy-cis,cis-muconate cycloisomerase [Loktanella atrilutea]
MTFANALYDGLFADPQIATLWSAEAQIAHMRAFEAAFSRAMGQAGRFDATLAVQAADHIADCTIDVATLSAGCASDGLPVPALIKLLKAGAGNAGQAIHTGATSQDVLDTGLALTLRETSDLIDDRLAALAAGLVDLSDRFGAVPLMGRTRMQAALPVTVADRIRLWRAPLVDHRARLTLARAQTERLSLSGPTGTGDFTDVAAPMAQALGLTTAPVSWHTDRSGIVEYANLLALISGSLGKMGQDITLMAQQGLAEVAIAGGGSSSAMAHKQNPILAELLVTLARFNAGQAGLMQQAMVHEQERSGAAWALEWMVLPLMAQATGRALTAAADLTSCITGMGTPGLQEEPHKTV